MTSPVRHMAPTPRTGRDFVMRGPEGEIAMPYPLRLWDVVDYGAHPGSFDLFCKYLFCK